MSCETPTFSAGGLAPVDLDLVIGVLVLVLALVVCGVLVDRAGSGRVQLLSGGGATAELGGSVRCRVEVDICL